MPQNPINSEPPKESNLQCKSVMLNDGDEQDSILPTSIIIVLIYRTNLMKYGHLGIAPIFIGSQGMQMGVPCKWGCNRVSSFSPGQEHACIGPSIEH